MKTEIAAIIQTADCFARLESVALDGFQDIAESMFLHVLALFLCVGGWYLTMLIWFYFVGLMI